jgi:hypothetical protein
MEDQRFFRELVESASDMYDKVNFQSDALYNEPAPEPYVSRNQSIRKQTGIADIGYTYLCRWAFSCLHGQD